MKKIKVLHILDNLHIGGKEKNVVDICHNISADYECSILCLYKNDIDSRTHDVDGINVSYLNLLRKTSIFFQIISNLWNVRKIYKDIVKYQPDIIHTHTFLYSCLPVLLSIFKFSKAIHFHSIHTSGMHYSKLNISSRIKLYIEKRLFSILKTKIVAISKSMFLKFSRIFPSNEIMLVPNGIHIKKNKIKNINNNKLHGVYVSRLVDGKNHNTIIHAAELVKIDQVGNFDIAFIGDGPNRESLELLTQKFNVTEEIIYMGERSDVIDILGQFDFGIFASESEGFSLALVEMMAAGLPIIASNATTILEMGINDDNSLLFETLNARDLSDKIITFIKDNELRTKLSANSILFASEFSIENMIIQIQNCYKNAYEKNIVRYSI